MLIICDTVTKMPYMNSKEERLIWPYGCRGFGLGLNGSLVSESVLKQNTEISQSYSDQPRRREKKEKQRGRKSRTERRRKAGKGIKKRRGRQGRGEG